jgi:Cu/Ag efflux protein CusF
MKTLITASLIAFASLGTVSVQAAGDHAGHAMAAPAAASAEMQMVDGQVKKVDKAAGKVTLVARPADQPEHAGDDHGLQGFQCRLVGPNEVRR